MSTYAIKATFYVEADSEVEAEGVFDDGLSSSLLTNSEVVDVWKVRD